MLQLLLISLMTCGIALIYFMLFAFYIIILYSFTLPLQGNNLPYPYRELF